MTPTSIVKNENNNVITKSTPTTTNAATEPEPIYLAAVEGGGSSFRVAICQVVSMNNKDNSSSTTSNTNSNNNNNVLSLIIPIDTTTSIIIVKYKQIDSKNDAQYCINECCTFFQEFLNDNNSTTGTSSNTKIKFCSLGIGTFGPVGLNISDDNNNNYGCILSSSPKSKWRNVNILQPIATSCQLQYNSTAVWIETDVNAPAYSEYIQHNNNSIRSQNSTNEKKQKTISSCAYITVGTGVGVGLVINNEPVHGMMHPEGGHVPIQPLVDLDESNNKYTGYSWGNTSTSSVPFFGQNTVEGIVSSIALSERYLLNQKHTNPNSTTTDTSTSTDNDQREILSTIDDNDIIWDHAINGIANLCVTIILLTSIEKIIIGGGIVTNRSLLLLPKIRARVVHLINNYISLPMIQDTTSGSDSTVNSTDSTTMKMILSPDYITTSQNGDNAGLVGSIVLSYRAYLRSSSSLSTETVSSSTNNNDTTTTTTTTTTLDKDDEQQQNNENNNNKDIQSIKQIAFSQGIWHGMILGIIGTGLIVKYTNIVSILLGNNNYNNSNKRR